MFDDYFNKFPKPGSPESIMQLKIGVIAGIIILAVFAFLIVNIKVNLNAAPEQIYRAEVIEKRTERTSRGRARHLLVFELSNGEKKQFVNSKFFRSINEGDKGMLTFKETDGWMATNTLLISFDIE